MRTVVGELEHLELRQFAKRCDPRIACFRRDDVQRFERLDLPEMLEKCRIIGIFLAMIVRPRSGDGQKRAS